jgi:hypothetical protein
MDFHSGVVGENLGADIGRYSIRPNRAGFEPCGTVHSSVLFRNFKRLYTGW